MQTIARLLLLLNCQPEARVGIDSLRLMKCGPVDDLIQTGVLAELPPVDYINPDYCAECSSHEVFESETPDGPRLFDACVYGEVDGEIHPDRLRRWTIDARGITNRRRPVRSVPSVLPGGRKGAEAYRRHPIRSPARRGWVPACRRSVGAIFQEATKPECVPRCRRVRTNLDWSCFEFRWVRK